MSRFFDRIVLVLNILASLGLLLAYLSPLINPASFFLPALFGLAYPFILLTHLIFVSYWLFRLKKEIFLSLALILLGWNHLAGLFPVHLKQAESCGDASSLTTMTYNVHGFGVFPDNDAAKRDQMAELVLKEGADILCIQEYFAKNHEGLRHMDHMAALSELPHVAVFHTSSRSRHDGSGVAIFSRYPIVKTIRIPFGTYGNAALYTDIKVKQDTIRVFNIHLQSIRFRQENYAFMDTVRLKYSNEQMREIRSIGARLKKAFVLRAEQADMMANFIGDSPHPVIVMGDFNDTPQSYAYRRIRKGLRDAFRHAGKGLGNTYAGNSLPSFRIDHVLYDTAFRALQCKRIRSDLSDHYPVVASFCLSEPASP